MVLQVLRPRGQVRGLFQAKPVITLLIALISAYTSVSAQSNPKEYRSAEGSVSVVFPDTFNVDRHVDSGLGIMVTVRGDYFSDAWQSGVTYQMSYAIFEEDLSKKDPKTLLNSAMHDLAANMRGEVWDKGYFNYSDKPGMAGTILSNANGLIAQVQIVQNKQIQYTLLVVYPIEDELTSDAYNAINFFNSFKLL